MKKFLNSLLPEILFLLLLFFIINFVLLLTKVSGPSMKPTLNDGDFLVFNRWTSYLNRYKQGDLIVFETKDGRLLVKRIIGLPGDKVELKDGRVYVNSKELIENYTDQATNPELSLEVRENCLFVLGDNRSNSLDSRDLGLINFSRVKGTKKAPK